MQKIIAGMLVALALAWTSSAVKADQIDDYYNYQCNLIRQQLQVKIHMLTIQAQQMGQNGAGLQASLWLQRESQRATDEAILMIPKWQKWRLAMKRRAAGG